MKVFIAFVLTISAVSSIGSGPYLPSGWRPSGPAFLLPSEVRTVPKLIGTTLEPRIIESVVFESTALDVKIPESTVIPSEPTLLEAKTPESTSESTTSEDRTTESAGLIVEPVQDVFGQETEASGSDFLREYGPPDVLDIHESISVQGLPDIVSVHKFRQSLSSQDESVTTAEVTTLNTKEVLEEEKVLDQKEATIAFKSSEEEISVQTDATIELKSGRDAGTTESFIEEVTSEANTEKFEQTIAVEETTSSQLITEGTLKDEEPFVLLVKSTDNQAQVTVDTSAEYLPPILNEVLSQDNGEVTKDDAIILKVPVNPSDSVIDKINQGSEKIEENSSSGQAPDILNEQERIGFREYGPPRFGTEEKSEAKTIENNETRRRRFSSKFASFNKH